MMPLLYQCVVVATVTHYRVLQQQASTEECKNNKSEGSCNEAGGWQQRSWDHQLIHKQQPEQVISCTKNTS
jgi:hypothetical protein